MAYGTPVVIDPVTLGVAWSMSSPSTSMVGGPWSFAGALYTFLVPEDNSGLQIPQPGNVWKSTDSGLTWNVQDSGNAVLMRGWEASFDGGVISVVNCSPPVPAAPIDMFVVEFDCATDTWGLQSSASPAQTIAGPQLILSRSDGSKLIVYSSVLPVLPDLHAVTYNGGVWGVPFLVTNFAGLTSWGLVTGCIDLTDTAHVFYTESSGVLSYQAVLVSDALGATDTLVDADLIQFGIPTLHLDQILLPVLDLFGAAVRPSLFVGTPLSAPVFTLFSDIDPTFADSPTAYICPMANIVGGKLTILWACLGDAVLLRLVETGDFVTFVCAGATVFDMLSTPPPPGINFVGQFFSAFSVIAEGISFMAGDLISGNDIQIFLPLLAPPAVVQSVILSLYGWKLFKQDPCGEALQILELPKVTRAV